MTKRCKNCGWLNDDNNEKCEKCYAPLPAEESSIRPLFSQTARESDGSSLKRTISENQFFGGKEPTKEEPEQNVEFPKHNYNKELNCPNCGYPVRQGMRNCPDCGTPIVNTTDDAKVIDNGKKCINCGCMNDIEACYCKRCGAELGGMQKSGFSGENGNRPGTINPWMKPENGVFCTLKPIAWVGENVAHQPISFSGESVILNRANTDPNNQSITTQEQAELSYENGDWYILDKSSQHTTYVLASQKIKLHKGDTIVLGNRLFEFN